MSTLAELVKKAGTVNLAPGYTDKQKGHKLKTYFLKTENWFSLAFYFGILTLVQAE